MLQGLDIPWGVMVYTWDLIFSSTSDVPDGLDRPGCLYMELVLQALSRCIYDGISFPASFL